MTPTKVQELQSEVEKLRQKLHEKELELYHIDPTLCSASSSSITNTTGFQQQSRDKAGSLWKWQDRQIGWGGTKWARRFVHLDSVRCQLKYYRSSSSAKKETPSYILSLKGCAVQDDGCKTTSKGEEYHVFSIHIIQKKKNNKTAAEPIVPLLRFSTTSLAEKTQWIELISEACEIADRSSNNNNTSSLSSPLMISSVKKKHKESSELLSKSADDDAAVDELISTMSTTNTSNKASSSSSNSVAPQNGGGGGGKLYRQKSRSYDAARSNPRVRSGYAPSRPMHRAAEPSYLSEEAAEQQNYRGLFNLGVIILIISNFRLILDNLRKHGLILLQYTVFLDIKGIAEAPLDQFPLIFCEILLHIPVVVTYLVELGLAQKFVSEISGITLHVTNLCLSLLVPMLIVWYRIDTPVAGIILMMQATVSFMKLGSYVHANNDYRRTQEDSHQATVALIQDLELRDRDIEYPKNITLGNLYYFWFAPTLTYQIAFPRTPRIRWLKVLGLLLRMSIAVTVLTFLVTQTIFPSLDHLVENLEGDGKIHVHDMAEILLKLTIPNTYVWLMIFYLYFHLFLNFMAELLRFGDRVFYKDWWNSAELSAYWRLWNMPVHYWLIRHVYFPCIRRGVAKNLAVIFVFFISGVLHEIIISIPFHLSGVWSFLGMMSQVPLVFITKYLDKKFPGSSIGNVIFWISFCIVGQPMAVLLYTIDHWNITSRTIIAGEGISCEGPRCEL